ncbi:DUF1896 family protein [Pedobacter agri]|uniref:DUF1896 family protein n=1 Tax=Pedobacter agri TaxID=454586 RepID=UPI00292F3FD8|nr:DUF1896 family protein [Pedobacter agri]
MKATRKDLSCFTVRLVELLHASFPELSDDFKFISDRSMLAAEVYQEAFRAGNPIAICNLAADDILFHNLRFSRFDMIFKVVCNEFYLLMPDEALQLFAIKMFSVCESVFKLYILTEDFADSPEFDQLYSELTGTIQIWIEGNGI